MNVKLYLCIVCEFNLKFFHYGKHTTTFFIGWLRWACCHTCKLSEKFNDLPSLTCWECILFLKWYRKKHGSLWRSAWTKRAKERAKQTIERHDRPKHFHKCSLMMLSWKNMVHTSVYFLKIQNYPLLCFI